MKHDDVLKRARLLAQAANEAADSALLSQQKEINDKKSQSPLPRVPPNLLSQEAFPSVKRGKSSSLERLETDKLKTVESPTPIHSEKISTSLPPISQKGETALQTPQKEDSSQLNEISSPTLPSNYHEIDQHVSTAPTERLPTLQQNCDPSPPRVTPSNSSQPPVDESSTIVPAMETKEICDPISQYIGQYLQSRANVIVQRHAPQQVLCYLCCAEFGTSSLLIHQKTCWSKQYVHLAHLPSFLSLTSCLGSEWALERILNDETLTKKEAKKNWKKCEVPSNGSSLPQLPSTSSEPSQFETYNQEALRLFFGHVMRCLWCRMNNSIAKMIAEKVKRDEEERRRKREMEEEERRRREREEEERRRRELEDEERRKREEEERRRREEDERRRREEEERRRMQLEDEASEAERRRLLALGKHSFLKKGKGTQAANQTAKLMEEKERDDRAKQEIVNYSLTQAKKKGYVSDSVKKADTTSAVKYIEVTETEMSQMMEKQAQNHSSWDSKWSLEEEEKFANSEVILQNKCV
jgi:hypothetical protein